MALLQAYKNNELVEIGFGYLSIFKYLKHFSIEYIQLDDINLSNTTQLYDNKFIRHDVIQIRESMDLNFHYHEDDEARIIIDGEVIFMFMCGEYRLELKTSRGDYVSIPKNMIHTVIIKEPTKVLRLFTSMDDYKAITV